MLRFSICIVTVLLLNGCTTTQQAMRRANDSFVGRNIDDFVMAHGVPGTKHKLTSGEYIYVWNSGVISYNMPATTTMSGTNYGGYYSGSATTTGGGTLNVFCEVQIHTSAEGEILSIRPLRDTWGNWTTSRCSECFK